MGLQIQNQESDVKVLTVQINVYSLAAEVVVAAPVVEDAVFCFPKVAEEAC